MMRCGVCGRDNAEGFKFCQYCGGILAASIDLRDPRISGPRQEVIRAVHDRMRIDKKLSVWWVAAIIIMGVGSVVASLVAMIMTWDYSMYDDMTAYWEEYAAVQAVSSVGSFVSLVVFAALVYQLVKRQNEHYAREAYLRSAIVSLLRGAAWSQDRMIDIAPETMAISTVERRQEKERNPWFWVFVVVLPTIISVLSTVVLYYIVTDETFDANSDITALMSFMVVLVLLSLAAFVLLMYLLYFLTRTMLDHDSRWNVFSYNTRRAMSKLGFPAGVPYRTNTLPSRSMALYIILTIFTGIFVFYWLYVLVKDPNDHFDYQREFEDNLLSSISPEDIQPIPSASLQ